MYLLFLRIYVFFFWGGVGANLFTTGLKYVHSGLNGYYVEV